MIPGQEEELDRILEAAKYAPTAKNLQRNALMVLQDQEKISELLSDLMEPLGNIGKDLMDTQPEISAFILRKYNAYTDKE